jgi:hypothetical protein
MKDREKNEASALGQEEKIKARGRRSTKRSRTGCLTCKCVFLPRSTTSYSLWLRVDHAADSEKLNVTRQSLNAIDVGYLALGAMATRNQCPA